MLLKVVSKKYYNLLKNTCSSNTTNKVKQNF